MTASEKEEQRAGRYNQKVKSACMLIAVAALLSGCHHNIENKEAVKQGVVDYLNKRSGQTGLDMKLMNLDVTNVTFNNNEAVATVSFKPKTGEAGGMSMNYALERHGNEWVVKGRKETGMNPHGAQGMPGMPGAGMPTEPGATMPPGHPNVAPPEKK